MNKTYVSIFLIFLIGCSSDPIQEQLTFPVDYQKELDEFYSNRHHSLTHETGWMRLAGMYWLHDGQNTLGSADDNDVVFPSGFIPDYAATIIVDNGTAILVPKNNTEFKIEGVSIGREMIFSEEGAVEISHGTLTFVVIERGGDLAIRLWNSYNPEVDIFTGFPRYDLNEELYLKARFITYETPEVVRIVNILGQEEDIESPGRLVFHYRGNNHELITLPGGNRMFVIVGDLTNRTETYQAGRYIYVDYPDTDSQYTILDFNKLYNPPCAYSPFTTCQLPPRENILPIQITAGEKRPIAK